MTVLFAAIAGCVVTFDPGAGIACGDSTDGSDSAAIVAKGTSNGRILFTFHAGSPQPGDWRGLVFSGGTAAATTGGILFANRRTPRSAAAPSATAKPGAFI